LERHLIYERVTGSLGRGSDRWTLIVQTDTGQKMVQHEWSLDKGAVRHGATTISLNEFLKSDQSDTDIMQKLGKLLTELGLNDDRNHD